MCIQNLVDAYVLHVVTAHIGDSLRRALKEETGGLGGLLVGVDRHLPLVARIEGNLADLRVGAAVG